ncbi:hypothetical protein JW935_25395 [candidate division KSB1 bacterium]|nr:hypothetical protein [candidate division KSB1 bacterium]
MTSFTSTDLEKLSAMSTTDRAFLTVYAPAEYIKNDLKKSFEKIRALLNKTKDAQDERDHFEENVKMVHEYLERNPVKSGSVALFSCWILDFFKAVEIPVTAEPVVWIDSSPYIRPLAELQDEYENFIVVIADNKKSRMYIMSSLAAGSESVVHGDIKNHVKKGGWSQQRYERRRDKQLLHYARDIAQGVQDIEKVKNFTRIVLVGGKEILDILMENLPPRLQDMVVQKALDLGKDERYINHEIWQLFEEQERASESDLWQEIRAEVLKGGLGVAGLEDVLQAVQYGQVDSIIVDRNYKPQGQRCRDCKHLQTVTLTACEKCGSQSLFTVDVVNEIVEIAGQTGADIEFCDPIETLTGAGKIAARLRFKYDR